MIATQIIDGHRIARQNLDKLREDAAELAKHNITPELAVILIGSNPSSLSFVNQKQKAAAAIGAGINIIKLDKNTNPAELKELIARCNNNPKVHGIIIQRPVPPQLQNPEILHSVALTKDVDGFNPDSRFEPPVALAVIKILEYVYKLQTQILQKTDKFQLKTNDQILNANFVNWLFSKNIVVIGRGETAGRPIYEYFKKISQKSQIPNTKYQTNINIQNPNKKNGEVRNYCATIAQIHSQTSYPNQIIRNSQIIISCVGKPKIINKSNIGTNQILISVGMHKDAKGAIHGDYEAAGVDGKCAFFSPTPGGVGPVNVSYLMSNLIQAATNTLS